MLESPLKDTLNTPPPNETFTLVTLLSGRSDVLDPISPVVVESVLTYNPFVGVNQIAIFLDPGAPEFSPFEVQCNMFV